MALAFRSGLWRLWLMALALWLIASASAVAAGPNLAAISGVRIGENAGQTRFVLDFDRAVDYSLTIMANPYRAVITLPAVQWQLLPGVGRSGRGLVQNFRYGAWQKDSFRLVLELNGPAKAMAVRWLPPGADNKAHRLVLDLQKINAADFKAQNFGAYQPAEVVATKPPAPKPAPSNQAASAPAMPEPPKPVEYKTIVVDAGHGGVDPGAIGIRDSYEKNITLAVAQELAASLRRNPQYRVILTRERDVFVPLAERRQIARNAKADLFISIHADHHTNRATRGASVYTLSEKASDAESAKLAEQENKADLLGGLENLSDNEAVSNILLDLVQQETVGHASLFGSLLVRKFSQDPAIEVLSNPLRSAGFVVLRSPDVPSVLVELGFLSNAQDESALNRPEYRRRLAMGLVLAVDAYFAKIQPHSNGGTAEAR
jgi:N-acetylmuramoyl-L-alanine amidase